MTKRTEAKKRSDAKVAEDRCWMTFAANRKTEPEVYKIMVEMKQRGNCSAEIKRLILREYENE